MYETSSSSVLTASGTSLVSALLDWRCFRFHFGSHLQTLYLAHTCLYTMAKLSP